MTTQGIEARRGETGTGSIHESPSGKAGAPKLDWTAPLMLDDGKGTGVVDVRERNDGRFSVDLPLGTSWRLGDAYGGDTCRAFNADGTHRFGLLPRIINRPKPVEQLPADEPDTVTVPRMTEAEVMAKAHKLFELTISKYAYLSAYQELGLIRPDDPLDRFTASHPNWRDLPVEDAVRLALEQRGEG